MTTSTRVSQTLCQPQLLGQPVVVIGGSFGIGLETARRACAERAELILTDVSSGIGVVPGKHEHRTIKGGIGHNLPQEAPQAFAQAVVDVDGF